VAPEVKTISSACAPIRAPTWRRARSIRAAAARPKAWLEEALPKSPPRLRQLAMASATRVSTGVVAA
jgi:hypothetical protein